MNANEFDVLSCHVVEQLVDDTVLDARGEEVRHYLGALDGVNPGAPRMVGSIWPSTENL
ncbi:hypothetical protein ACSMXN_05530 [Jatrophihabitans sp. DSM 45814]